MKTIIDYTNALKGYFASNKAESNSTVVDYTPIVAVDDALPITAKALKVKVEAVQDLHGFDNPWVGGAGKNKFNINSIVSATRGTILIANNGVTITATGTDAYTNQSDAIPVSEGETLTVSWDVTGTASGVEGVVLLFDNNGNTVKNVQAGTRGFTYTVPSGITSVKIRFGVTASGNTIYYNNIMIRKNGDATYEPYENICPISGWDNAKVTRSGKNLFDKTTATNGVSIAADGTTSANNTRSVSDYIKVTPSTTYYASHVAGSDVVRTSAVYDKDKNFISIVNVSGDDNVSRTIVIPSNGYYIRLCYTTTNVDTVQFEKGETATTYESYQGIKTTISLNGTRYGGVLDVTSGVLTVKSKYVQVPNESWSKDTVYSEHVFYKYISTSDVPKNADNNTLPIAICDSYPIDTVTNIDKGLVVAASVIKYQSGMRFWICDNRFTSASDLATELTNNPVYMVYELDTPITVQLTPTQVYLLYGYNTIWTDTGNTYLEYLTQSVGNIAEEVGELEDGVQALTNEVRGNWSEGGKNLFDPSAYSSYKQSDGSYRLTGSQANVIRVNVPKSLVGVECTASVYLDLTKETTPTQVYICATVSGTTSYGNRISANSEGVSKITFTPQSVSDTIGLTFGSEGSYYFIMTDLRLEKGSEVTEYQPYAKTNVELTADKADKTDLASISITGTTNTTGATIASGTYFYLNGALVKAKTSIANGATMTANTNYEVVTAGALNELSSYECLIGNDFPISYADNTMAYTSYNKFERKGNLVRFTIGFYPTSNVASWTTLATINSAYKPKNASDTAIVIDGDNGLVNINHSSGNIAVNHALTANKYYHFTIMYFMD